MLIRATKIKSKKADYTINYCTNERGKSNSGCHRLTLKCFYSFYFSEQESNISSRSLQLKQLPALPPDPDPVVQ